MRDDCLLARGQGKQTFSVLCIATIGLLTTVFASRCRPFATPESASILFEKSAQRFASIPTWNVGLADLDGEGDLDIFLATFGTVEGPSEVWLNQLR